MKRLFATITLVGLGGASLWAAESSGETPLEFNPGLFAWTLVTFLVMFLLLARFAFKPIAEALDRRGETIRRALEGAEQSRAEAKKLLEQYQQQLTEARQEAKKLLEEGRALGENVRQEMVARATAEAGALIQRAQEEIQREKEKSLLELRETVAGLSVQIAGKIIERQLDEAAHRQLVQNLVNDLSKIRRA